MGRSFSRLIRCQPICLYCLRHYRTWGPSHGGANQAVLEMLEEIGTEDQIDKYVAKAKDKNDPFKLMGFGHRVYKNFDPRAKVMKETCDEVLELLGIKRRK